jgi:hypothetical protein
MQVADYLEADISRAAEAFCAVLVRGNRGAPPAWRLLKAESAHIRDAVLACHPGLASRQGISVLLPALPKCLGLHVVRSRMHMPDALWDLTAPSMRIDISNTTVCRELPPLLPGLTDVRSIAICTKNNGCAWLGWPRSHCARCARGHGDPDNGFPIHS